MCTNPSSPSIIEVRSQWGHDQIHPNYIYISTYLLDVSCAFNSMCFANNILELALSKNRLLAWKIWKHETPNIIFIWWVYMFFFYIAMYSIYGKREEVDPLLSSIHFSILFPVLGVFDAGIFRCEDALWDGSLPLFLPCSSAQRWPCDRSFPAVGSWPGFNVHMSHGHADVYAYIYMCMYIYIKYIWSSIYIYIYIYNVHV